MHFDVASTRLLVLSRPGIVPIEKDSQSRVTLHTALACGRNLVQLDPERPALRLRFKFWKPQLLQNIDSFVSSTPASYWVTAASMSSDILAIKQDLDYIQGSLLNYGKCQTMPPIIDSAFEHEHFRDLDARFNPLDNTLLSNLRDSIPGLRILRESVKRDIELLDKFIQREVGVDSTLPSTNALYLIAVWNELVRAPLPVLFVDKMFPGSNSPAATRAPMKERKPVGVKVDIVASGGERWIRVNTTKNNRLLVEFREQDSYLTDSDDESGSECTTRKPSAVLDNSVLRMGHSLLEAAKASVSDETQRIPKITLRLTRLIPDSASLSELEQMGLKILDPDLPAKSRPETDQRIGLTLRELLKIGMDVELGELSLQKINNIDLETDSSPKHFLPTQQINVDLSVLLALLSDVAHSPLPASIDDAHIRYIPTLEERERSRLRREKQRQLLSVVKAGKEGGKSEKMANKIDSGTEKEEGSGLKFSAGQLERQVIQEMDLGFIEGIRRRLDASEISSLDSVEFWTTKDARDRCLRIVEKIGGPKERQRANALFWESGPCLLLGPKYVSLDEAQEAYWKTSRYSKNYLPLVPIKVLDDQTLQTPVLFKRAPFWDGLERSCRRLLSQGSVDHPRALPDYACQAAPVSLHLEEQADKQDHESTDGEIQRAPVMKANPRLTVHTVDTLLCGAVRGWTTLTSNRSSVREILKEIIRETIRPSTVKATDQAAIWLVDPRSLAEGMRSDM